MICVRNWKLLIGWLGACPILLSTCRLLGGDLVGSPRSNPNAGKVVPWPDTTGIKVTVIRPEDAIPRPGSREEAEVRRRVELARQGKLPGVVFGSTKPPPAPPSTGTVIAAGPMRGRVPTPIEAAFIRAMSVRDPSPAERTAHFAWIEAHTEVRRTGWSGIIMSSVPVGDGSWRFQVRVFPQLFASDQIVRQNDFVMEHYLFDGRNLRLVGSDASTPKPELRRFDEFLRRAGIIKPDVASEK